MAIQPIDLQTLFTQMDKVGKNQAAQREGLQIQQALQQIESQRKAEEQVRSVNEAQDMGEEAEKLKDKGPRRHYEGREKSGERSAEDDADSEEEKTDPGLIRDPRLGRNIDISG
ncbi:MAG: hypothetical protein LBC62_06190 [Treponema sp.]|jgi:hypothetical protein|nr:hypothetical protein [Treponema sp.]